jgi:hypothetical protein
VRAAHDKLSGVVRQGIMLYLYTDQRGSDIVRCRDFTAGAMPVT